MDRVFSTRMDESVAQHIKMLAAQLHTTNKNIIESAIRLFALQVEKEKKIDVFARTSGAWKRKESVAESIEQAKAVFRDAMSRHQR